MNQAEVEDGNHTILTRVADEIARALCEGARKVRSKKLLLSVLAEQLEPVRVRCPACQTEVPAMLLGREDAEHICVVARRTNFVNLRRRLEDHFRSARPKCQRCIAVAQSRAAKVAADGADEGPPESGGAIEHMAGTPGDV